MKIKMLIFYILFSGTPFMPMKWNIVKIRIHDGQEVPAAAPVIISASRATDIPAFYGDRFMAQFRRGYLKWKNPFNGKSTYVSFRNTRVVVFWTKNPKPFIDKGYLNELDDAGTGYYFHFTLNDYVREGWESKAGSVDRRIETFIRLAERIGKEKVIWRFDPYILTPSTPVDELLRRTEYIGNRLHPYTERLVFSFADIDRYKHVSRNMRRAGVKALSFDETAVKTLADGLARLNRKWNLQLATCAEKWDLTSYGIVPHKCIDDELLVRLFPHDKLLMDFIGYTPALPISISSGAARSHAPVYRFRIRKDPGQRPYCGCIPSKDIGTYNSCPMGCVYCYANTSPAKAMARYKQYRRRA